MPKLVHNKRNTPINCQRSNKLNSSPNTETQVFSCVPGECTKYNLHGGKFVNNYQNYTRTFNTPFLGIILQLCHLPPPLCVK